MSFGKQKLNRFTPLFNMASVKNYSQQHNSSSNIGNTEAKEPNTTGSNCVRRINHCPSSPNIVCRPHTPPQVLPPLNTTIAAELKQQEELAHMLISQCKQHKGLAGYLFVLEMLCDKFKKGGCEEADAVFIIKQLKHQIAMCNQWLIIKATTAVEEGSVSENNNNKPLDCAKQQQEQYKLQLPKIKVIDTQLLNSKYSTK